MSDCGGIVIGLLAIPLLVVALLIAGVAYLAIEGAKLVGHLVVEGVRLAGEGIRLAAQGIQLAGQGLASAVRTGYEVLAATTDGVTQSMGAAATWAGSMFDSAAAQERIQNQVVSSYQRLNATTAAGGSLLPILDSSNTTSLASETITLAQGVSLQQEPVFESSVVNTERQLAADGIARAQAVMQTLQGETPVRLVAEQWFAPRLADAQQKLQQAQLHQAINDHTQARRLAEQAEEAYAVTLHDAYARLVKAERITVAAQVGNSLEDLGYQVKVASSEKGFAFVGRQGHRIISLVTRAGGQLQMDMAGFQGDECDAETRHLLDALQRNGLQITAQQLTRHGRFEGGALIRQAQRSGKSLETALLEALELPQQPSSLEAGYQTTVRRKVKVQDNTQQARAWVWHQHTTKAGG